MKNFFSEWCYPFVVENEYGWYVSFSLRTTFNSISTVTILNIFLYIYIPWIIIDIIGKRSVKTFSSKWHRLRLGYPFVIENEYGWYVPFSQRTSFNFISTVTILNIFICLGSLLILHQDLWKIFPPSDVVGIDWG